MAPVLWAREVSQVMWYLKSPTGREGGHPDAFEDAGCPVGLWNGEQGGVCLGVRLWCKSLYLASQGCAESWTGCMCVCA